MSKVGYDMKIVKSQEDKRVYLPITLELADKLVFLNETSIMVREVMRMTVDELENFGEIVQA